MTGAGKQNLDRLLASLSAALSDRRYAFEAHAAGPLPDGAFALVREVEGDAIIVERADGDWARISLGVHSSLEAVGLTAELARRLADGGISANVVAGLRHDHFFVPWARRDEALGRLTGSPPTT